MFEETQVRLVLATHGPPWEPVCLISPINDSLRESGRKNWGDLKLKGLGFFSTRHEQDTVRRMPQPGWMGLGGSLGSVGPLSTQTTP